MTLQNAFEGLAVESKQDAEITALGALLTELAQKLEPADLAALATAAKQDIAAGKLDTLHTDLAAIAGYVDGLEGFTDGIETKLDTLHTDAGTLATQTTAAAILAKLSADPATQTTLAAVLAKLTADPSTETTLAALSAKYPAAAALADAVANPTLTKLASFMHLFNGTTWDRIRGDTTNGVDVDPTRLPPDATATGSLAVTGSVTLALAGLGARPLAAFDYLGTYTGLTVAHEVSYDGGTTYQNLPVIRSDTTGNSPAASQAMAGTNMWFLGLVAAGATHIRARVSAIASGTVAITVAASVGSTTPYLSVAGGNINATMQPTTVQIGFTQSTSIWWDETSTPLAGAGTFTGSARDAFAVVAGQQMNNSTSRGMVEVRLEAIADVAGTLYLEVSADNSTWYRVKQIALAAAPTLFYGEIIHRPAARYARLVFVNGAGAQATFRAFTTHIGG